MYFNISDVFAAIEYVDLARKDALPKAAEVFNFTLNEEGVQELMEILQKENVEELIICCADFVVDEIKRLSGNKIPIRKK